MKILVAGASGALGRHLVPLLESAGHSLILLSRRPPSSSGGRQADLTVPRSLDGVCRDAEIVISCAGASLQLNFSQPTSFHDIDYLGNNNLLAEARRSGVRKFVYVAAAGQVPLGHTAYIQAHEHFVSALCDSGLPHTIVRLTGFFYVFAAFLDMAARGFIPMAGDGFARTNPIHEADAAEACLAAIASPLSSIEAGGPEVFARLRLLELAFDALGRIPRIKRAPGILMRAPLLFLKPLHPRLHDLVEFGLAVSQTDVIAPRFGRKRIGDYLRVEALRRFPR
jgi:uncharacterized protein YbjT (DUF2867 family)